MDTKTLGKWIYIVGLLVAIIAALVGFSNQWLSLVLMVAGVLVGLFIAPTGSLTDAIIRYAGLVLVAAALDNFIAVGPYVTAALEAVVSFLGPVLLTALVVWYVNDLRE